MKPILQINNLSKHFPGVKALDHMNFDLYPGEVHILAGENGAGKSTLCKCILGYEKPDEGQIMMHGSEVSFASPRDALSRGIGAVYQEFTLVPWLSVAENIYFNREPVIPGTGIILSSKMNQDARRILRELSDEDMDVTQPVKKLGIAGQQTVEIAKMLSSDSEIMIFDEPTAALSEKEVDSLFRKIRELRERGIGIIYISHRLQEYARIGDRVTVMRDGKYVGTWKESELPEGRLIYHMLGREAQELYVRKEPQTGMQSRTPESGDEEVLRAEKLRDKRGKVKDCSMVVRRGEIVGLAGLVGSGRTELANLLAGIEKPESGKVILHGKDVTGYNPGEMIREGLGLLPEDRKEQGLALRGSVRWNITAASLDVLFPSRRIRQNKERETVRDSIEKLAVSVPSEETAAAALSGGNQQKVVMAKWLLANTDFMIFDEPTRGIDVGAKMEIYQLMEDMVRRGKSILMISSELPEIMGMCDRIYVMKDGRIIDEVQRGEKSREALGGMMIADAKEIRPEETAAKSPGESGESGEGETPSGFARKFNAIRKKLAWRIPPGFYILLLMLLGFGLVVDHYYSLQNMAVIFRQAAPLLVIACGQTMIILTQGTDLSLGSIVSLTCVLWIFLLNWGVPMAAAIGITLLAAAVCGLCNGIVAAWGKIPVFITTLGTQNIFKSVALLLCGSLTIYYSHPVFRTVAKDGLFHLTWSTWIALIMFLLTLFLLNKTTFGKKVRALGGNPEAITLSGASRKKTMAAAFVLTGLLAGVGGLLICCRIESGNPNAGNGMEFSAVAAVLLGGTSLREGRGGVGGTIFGVLLIQILKSGLMQVGVSSIYQNAIIGSVVLGAIIIDTVYRYLDRDYSESGMKEGR